METTLTPETDAEARLMTLGSDDSCIDVYIERNDKNVEGDFVLADFARKLERECNDVRQKVALLCRDWADDDTRVKEIAKKHGIDAEYGDSETGYFKTCVDVAEKMSEAITDLTQRLQERQESFQAQLIRIEDTWREKLSAVTKDANRLATALDPIAWLHSMPEDGKAFNEAEEAMMAHETLASNH